MLSISQLRAQRLQTSSLFQVIDSSSILVGFLEVENIDEKEAEGAFEIVTKFLHSSGTVGIVCVKTKGPLTMGVNWLEKAINFEGEADKLYPCCCLYLLNNDDF